MLTPDYDDVSSSGPGGAGRVNSTGGEVELQAIVSGEDRERVTEGGSVPQTVTTEEQGRVSGSSIPGAVAVLPHNVAQDGGQKGAEIRPGQAIVNPSYESVIPAYNMITPRTSRLYEALQVMYCIFVSLFY